MTSAHTDFLTMTLHDRLAGEDLGGASETVVYPTIHLGTTEVSIVRDQNQQDVVHINDIAQGAEETVVLTSSSAAQEAFEKISVLGEGDVHDVRAVLGNMVKKHAQRRHEAPPRDVFTQL